MSLLDNLSLFLDEKKFSLEKFSSLIGYTEEELINLLSKDVINPSLLIKICNELDVSIDSYLKIFVNRSPYYKQEVIFKKEKIWTFHINNIEIKNDFELFRYRAPNDNSYFDIQNRVLSFTAPILFNDAYDCAIKYDEKIAFRKIYTRIKKYFPEIDSFDYNIKKRFRDTIFDIVRILPDHIRCEVGIASFSENNDSPVMWAQYADNGSGFVVGYNYQDLMQAAEDYLSNISSNKEENDELVKSFLGINAVQYSKVKHSFTNHIISIMDKAFINKANSTKTSLSDFFSNIDKDPNNSPYVLYFVKNESWSYEREWRMVLPNFNFLERMIANIDENYKSNDLFSFLHLTETPNYHHFRINVVAPSSLTLGYNISQVDKFLLYSYAKIHRVKLYQTYLDYSSPDIIKKHLVSNKQISNYLTNFMKLKKEAMT